MSLPILSAPGKSLPIERGVWRRTTLVALVALAHLLVPLGVAWQAAVKHQAKNFATEDAWMYRGMADMIHDHGLLYDGEEYGYEIRVRMPGYPLLILATDWIGSLLGVSGAWVLTISQIAMTCASCVLISRIAAHLTTERIGTITGV